MDVTIGTQVDFLFTTENPDTGAAQDADSLPTGVVYKDGVADALTVTISNVSTGLYKGNYTPTSGAGFNPGNDVSCVVTAIVGGVTGKAVVRQDRIKDVGGSVMSLTKVTNRLTNAFVDQYECPAGKTAMCYVHLTNTDSSARTVDLRSIPDGESPGNEHLKLSVEPLALAGATGYRGASPYGPYNLVAGGILAALASATNVVNIDIEIVEVAVPV